MSYYSVNSLLQQLKRIEIDKVVSSGFEDSKLYNDELLKLDGLELEKFNNLKAIIGTTKQTKKQKEVDVNNQGLTNEEYEELKRIQKKKKDSLTPEEKALLEKRKEQLNQKQTAISILRGISIRIPLMIYGADVKDNETITIDNFVEKVDDASWKEFMPNGVTKTIFNDFKKYYDKDIFEACGKKIRNSVKNADALPPKERIIRLAEIFSQFKNPDKETVLTPWRVVNMHIGDCIGGYNFYNEDYSEMIEEPRVINHGKVTNDVFNNPQVKILEINSKTGLYPLYMTYSIYRNKLNSPLATNKDYWRETVEKNIFILCKTEMAKKITQRTLVGFKDYKANIHVEEDIINKLKNKNDQLVSELSNAITWNMNDKTMEGKMKFDAIVGNPPYQENISDTNDNFSLSKQLFPTFIKIAIKLNSKYISLVTPSRWFTAEAQDKSFLKLREFLKINNHFKSIYNYPNNKDLFTNVEIAGGINYFLYQSDYNNDVEFYECNNTNREEVIRPLFEKGLDVVIALNSSIKILNKIQKEHAFKSLSDYATGRNAFGIVGKEDTLSKISKNIKENGYIKIFCAHESIKYIPEKLVTKNIEILNSWKVFTSKANGGAGLLSDSKPVSIIGKSYIGEPKTACTDSLIPIGCFNNKIEAFNLQKYMKTKFLRYLAGILKTSQNLYQGIYKFVPLQDFTDKSDIDWSKSISEIDQQLYKKYNLTEEEINFIESKIKPME